MRMGLVDYDELGRVRTTTQVSDVAGGTPGPADLVRQVLWDGERVQRLVQPAGRYTELVYDGLGRVVEKRDSLATNPNKVLYQYLPKSNHRQIVTRSLW